MTDYEIRRGHWKNIDGDKLPQLIEECFGSVKTVGPKTYETSYGALASCRVEFASNTLLKIETQMDKTAASDVANQTIRSWNQFLERATGYNAKQRGKRAQEKAKKAAAAAGGEDAPDVE
ncbi:MAG: DUF5611 family protein [Methanobacteriota archaeon]